MSVAGRRRIAVSLAGLAAVPALLLAACGNADHKVARDDRPDARASTEGVQTVLPTPVPDDSNLNSPFDGTPPENLVSQQGVGKRK
ncbi:MAG TPA: hypothetical protein VHZ96_12175 [Frankiaceae bacterium]|nr:hypothetical protein [Frankiaceae bacterium]